MTTAGGVNAAAVGAVIGTEFDQKISATQQELFILTSDAYDRMCAIAGSFSVTLT